MGLQGGASGLVLLSGYYKPTARLDVPPVAHPQTEWAGLLNVPARLTVIALMRSE